MASRISVFIWLLIMGAVIVGAMWLWLEIVGNGIT
jgi:hypothetical protein